MIQVSQEELWAFNILNGQVKTTADEAQRTVAARDILIKLLEIKYNAVFSQGTGTFEPKHEEPVEEPAKD